MSEQQGTPLFLLCRARTQRCALPLLHVRETMRPLPIQPRAGAPAFVLGIAVVRGVPTPVIDCGALLGETSPARPSRFVSVVYARRSIALAVEEVLGIRELASELHPLPPLLDTSGRDSVTALATLDAGLALVLGGAWLVPDSLWRTLEAQAQVR